MVIECQFVPARFKPSPWILAQIERIPSVRSADFLDHLRRPSMSAGEDGHSTIAGYSVDAAASPLPAGRPMDRSEEHTSELQSILRISSAAFCLKQKTATLYDSQIQPSHEKR